MFMNEDVIIHDVKAVKPERYHDSKKIHKFVSIFIDSSSSIIAAEKQTGDKYHVVSIDCNGMVKLVSWDMTRCKYVPLKDFVSDFNWE